MVRYKARYILFDVLYPNAPKTLGAASTHLEFSSPSDPSITSSYLSGLLRDGLAHQFGDYGAGVAGNLSVKYFSPATSTGIVRVSRDHYRLVWTALSFMNELKGVPVVIRVVRVSGTIKKVEQEAIRRARKEVKRVGGSLVDVEDIVVEDDEMEED
jgi:ribonuclease P/MRP protein subunit POP5